MKVCTKCHIEKEENEFYHQRRACKQCLRYECNQRAKKYHWDNRETVLKKKKELWHRRGKEQRKNRRANPHHKKEEHLQNLKRERSRIKRLTDSYVIKKLKDSGCDLITPEVIEIKRLIIQIKRKIKTNGKEKKTDKQLTGVEI